jgi:hypothetical protein
MEFYANEYRGVSIEHLSILHSSRRERMILVYLLGCIGLAVKKWKSSRIQQ